MKRTLISAGLLITGTLAFTATLAAQSSAKSAAPNSDPKTPWIQPGYKAPRTPAGQPDLQGVWANASGVPLQRPAPLGEKAIYTPEEFAAKNGPRRPTAGPNSANVEGTAADVHYDLDQFGLSRGDTVDDMRTSLITSPSGRLPTTLPAAAKRIQARNADRQAHSTDSTEYRGLAERCILWGNEGPPITPLGYNPNLQIVQSKDTVAITIEMIHDTRIIDMNRKAHLPENVRQWFGDSIGHWDGDTLVIDTTNFTDKTAFQGSGAKLHVTERLRRTSPNDMEYSFTVEDPDTWDQPWSATIPWPKADANVLFEYACHEGNYGMPNILSGYRADEAKKAAAAKK